MKRTLLFFLLMFILSACDKKLQTPQSSNMSAPLENTRWKLLTLPGMDTIPTLPKDVFIQFNKKDSTFHGQAGCNNMSARYTTEGNKLTIGPAALTRMMCPPTQMLVEELVTTAIRSTDNYLLKGNRLQIRQGDKWLAEFEADDQK